MQFLIEKMRADWPVVEQDRLACGDWTAEDAKEVGEAINQAVAKKDPDLIALWARWLADLSALAVGLKVIASTRRILDQARKQCEKTKA